MEKLFLFYSSFLAILQIASVNAADRPGMPETPTGYYECISGACSRQAPYLPPSRERDSLELRMTPVKDQGELGTCASFAASACAEYYTKWKNNGVYYYFPLSEAEFTVYAERHTPDGDCRQGLNLGEALIAATQRGLIHEKKWPYEEYVKQLKKVNNGYITEETDICINGKYSDRELRNFEKYKIGRLEVISHISRENISEAISYELQRASLPRKRDRQQHLEIHSAHPDEVVSSIKAYMQVHHTPVAASVATFGVWDYYNADIFMPTYDIASQWQKRYPRSGLNHQLASLRISNNRVNSILAESPAYTEGWHAIVLTGFNDKKKAFKFKNSWGEDWGQYQGYGWIPYDYISEYSSELVATFGS